MKSLFNESSVIEQGHHYPSRQFCMGLRLVGENPTPYGNLALWAVDGLSIIYWDAAPWPRNILIHSMIFIESVSEIASARLHPTSRAVVANGSSLSTVEPPELRQSRLSRQGGVYLSKTFTEWKSDNFQGNYGHINFLSPWKFGYYDISLNYRRLHRFLCIDTFLIVCHDGSNLIVRCECYLSIENVMNTTITITYKIRWRYIAIIGWLLQTFLTRF